MNPKYDNLHDVGWQIGEDVGGLHVRKDQVITDDYLKGLADERFNSSSVRERNYMKVCSIPVAVVEKWQREGFDILSDKNITARMIVRRLRKEGLDAFIATTKRVVIHMTKAEIRTKFLEILNNTSCTTALADGFIELGIARSQRMLKLPTQEAIDEVTIGEDFEGIDLPNDLVRIINIYVDGETNPRVLERIPLSTYLLKARSTNIPFFWTRHRTQILLNPTPASASVVKVLYYSEFDAFEDDDDDTPLSIIAPDLFIYGGLCYGADHYIDERKALFEQRFQQIVMELQGQADEDELSGGAVISNNYVFPDEDY